MFENEIKFISDFSLNKIKNFGSFVTFGKLAESELHPAIVTYISAELDYMIYRDRKKLLHNSIFDYTGREISDHFNVIAAEIKKNKKISIDDIEKLIFQAVSFNLNYVVRPKWSVTKLVFNDQDFVSVDELEKMLNYLFYYDYVKNVLAAYTSRRKVTQLTLTEFDLILNKIDRELFKANKEELINNAIHSIADFFNIGGIDKTTISLAAIEIFLKEKNLVDYHLKIRHSISGNFRKKYEIADLKKVLYSKETVFPESIRGSMEKDLPDTDVSESVDEDVIPKTGLTEKSIEVSGNDDMDIFAEEKIKAKNENEEITSEDIIFSEPQEETIPDFKEDDTIAIEEETPDEVVDNSLTGKVDAETSILEQETDKNTKVESKDVLSFEDELMGIFDENIEHKPPVEEIIEENFEEEVVESVSEIEIENEEVVQEEPETDEDDLVAFYERELEAMDEELKTQTVIEEPIEIEDSTKDEIENALEETSADEELISEAESISGETDGVEEEIIADETNEVEEEIIEPDEELDFSIFDEDEGDQDIKDIMVNLTADLQEELNKSQMTIDIENQEESIASADETLVESSEEFEINDDSGGPDLSEGSKKIIDEMLDDYFGDVNKKQEETETQNVQEETINETADTDEETKPMETAGIDEEIKSSETNESPESEMISEHVEEEPEQTDDENIFDTDLASNILDGTLLGDDISNMMDEIDDIIEKSNLEISAPGIDEDFKVDVQPDESEPDEDFQLEDETNQLENTIDFKDDSKINEETSGEDDRVREETPAKSVNYFKKTEEEPPKREAPVREKDLFSYLSRKEVKKIVSGVFAADHEDFVTTIEKISECSAYKEATEILKGVFFTYRISPYSKEAVTLTNAVSHFFRQL